MFFNCLSLSEIIGTDTWVLGNAYNMSTMFYGNRNLVSLDLSNATFASSSNLDSMFYNNVKLMDLRLDNTTIRSDCKTSSMMENISENCRVTVSSNFGKTESDCGFAGTFTVI